MAELLAARRDLGRELAAIGQELGQNLASAGGQRGRRRPGERAVARDHLGIDAVGFGQAAARPGKGAHPRGVDHSDRQVARAEQALRRALVAARGLHDQQIAGTELELSDECANARGIVADREPPAVLQAIDIQPRLADIDPDHTSHPLCPACLRACADQPFGLRRKRGGSAERRAPARGSFRSPTPRAHAVHGVGARHPCHITARQGSFGFARHVGLVRSAPPLGFVRLHTPRRVSIGWRAAEEVLFRLRLQGVEGVEVRSIVLRMTSILRIKTTRASLGGLALASGNW